MSSYNVAGKLLTWPYSTALLLYYPCNENGADPAGGQRVLDVSGNGNHGVLGRLKVSGTGSDAVTSRYPAYVASTAAFGNAPVAVAEDRAVTLRLRGASADGTEAVTFQVATLPSGGKLYDVNATGAVGAEVTAVPTDLAAAAVRYVPNADAAGIPFDVFKYRAKSAAGAFSYKTGVVVSITALDDPPSAVAVAVAATRAAAARVTLTATQPAGETAAGAALNYSITRLPARGTLYKAAGTSGTTTEGAAIASVPYDLGVDHVLVYVPSPPFGRAWQRLPTSPPRRLTHCEPSFLDLHGVV